MTAPTRTIVPRRRRGFAAITAITLIGLVAVALSSLALVFAAEAKRVRAEAGDAQLRQLLIAGSVAAKDAVAKGTASADVALPKELTESGGKVAVTISSKDNEALAVVQAAIGNRRSDETLHFTREGAIWKLSKTTLGTTEPQ